ncbi:MAG: hypothetical protein OXT64_15235 [Gammaproteobacteria bacterium]|nr:hypothetical protein [Gammaproteobacteria bacterium]
MHEHRREQGGRIGGAVEHACAGFGYADGFAREHVAEQVARD